MPLWLQNLTSGPAGTAITSGFRLYTLNPTNLIDTLPSSPLTADLTGVFPEGESTVGLSRIDQFGTESDITELKISIDGSGEVSTKASNPSNLKIKDKGGGVIELEWLAVDLVSLESSGQNELQNDPTDFQVANSSDLSTILDTVAFVAKKSFYSSTVSGFADGENISLAVRSRKSGANQEWILSQHIVVDAQSPEIPKILE